MNLLRWIKKGSFEMNYKAASGRKKLNRPAKIAVTALAAVLVGLYALGATLGSDSEKRQKISEAIEENKQLRGELSAKDERINELEEEVRQLKAELEAIPTPAPTPYVPAPTAPAEETQPESPREG